MRTAPLSTLSLTFLLSLNVLLACSNPSENGKPALDNSKSSKDTSGLGNPPGTEAIVFQSTDAEFADAILPGESPPSQSAFNPASGEVATSDEPASADNPDDELASEAIAPVAIGGAHLVCLQTETLDCRLDTEDQSNIAVPAEVTPQFSVGSQAVAFEKSPDPDYSWRLAALSASDTAGVTLVLSQKGKKSRQFKALFETNAMQIGDGAVVDNSACKGAITHKTKPYGKSFVKKFTLKATNNIVLDLQGVCGITADQSTLLQVSDAKNKIVFKKYLPSTVSKAKDVLYSVNELPAGTYTLSILLEDLPDLDDFFIGNFSISNQSL